VKANPRNETEFVNELRTWFIYDNAGQAYFRRIVSASGEPDLVFGRRVNGKNVQFYAEAKYVDNVPTSLFRVWDLLRNNQKSVCMKMAAAGFRVYLIVCIKGIEAWWYRFDPDMCLKSISGKVASYKVIYLEHISIRERSGKWKLVKPEEMEIPAWAKN
jgi:hypothetical protein